MEEVKVLSASRRTDLVGCYPEVLAQTLAKYPPETVHTVIIWTKNPIPMLDYPRLRKVLELYDQIYLHLTVTGLGGGILEPGIPHEEKILVRLPELVDLVKGPERISWRFDPIVHLRRHGKRIGNIQLFQSLAAGIASFGIRTCRISWMEPYGKVISRLKKKEWDICNLSLPEKQEELKRLVRWGKPYGIEFHACAVKGFSRSRCIDGELLQRLHPRKIPCSLRKAGEQRKLCGCTESLDIGWYTQSCRHGCLYCYANPAES